MVLFISFCFQVILFNSSGVDVKGYRVRHAIACQTAEHSDIRSKVPDEVRLSLLQEIADNLALVFQALFCVIMSVIIATPFSALRLPMLAVDCSLKAVHQSMKGAPAHPLGSAFRL